MQELSEELSRSNSPGEVFPVRCDLRNEADILNVFDEIRNKYGRLDICINNAGTLHLGTLIDGSTDDWREMIEV